MTGKDKRFETYIKKSFDPFIKNFSEIKGS